jgi:nifR3 family TIM-barrel protein
MPPPPTFHIGPIPIHGDVLLAPMDGYSDWPFRSICRELGSALSYTEFIKSEDMLERPHILETKLAFKDMERPVAMQLYGQDAETILEAALRVQELGPDMIDINMGCPHKTVVKRGAGAGLMRTPSKVARIVRELDTGLDVPVTGKIRLGWDQESRNAVEIARLVAEHGGALIAIHARTKRQGYTGQADWSAIAAVKQAVDIPVIGNGDVKTPADIERMKAQTGCDAVMIGRAAIGNPWIFARVERESIPPEQVKAVMLKHLERQLACYGERGLILFRKHAVRYLAPYNVPTKTRKKLLTREQPEAFVALLEEIFATLD